MSDDRLGKYRLLKLLATGGMGEVFLARQEGPAGFAKTVVVKRMLTHLGRDPKFVEMFLNEARLAAQLSHPNVVQIFELGEHNGAYFIAMEFIHGMNLRAIKRRTEERRMEVPVGFAAWICAQALKGLHYAHTLTDELGAPQHIVHRDVSPDNVLVGFNGIVKMVDFGIAKASTSISTTGAGTVKGKYAYMAPEQLSGHPADPRTDVYAMGVVLYELLAGERPFTGTSEAALVKAILQDAPRPLREVRPNTPPELEEICRRALAKNPQERFPTAESMSTALEIFVLGLGGVAQEEVKTLLQGLFSEEADMATVVSLRHRAGNPFGLPTPPPGPPSSAGRAPLPLVPAPLKADPTQPGAAPVTSTSQWVNVDLSTDFAAPVVAAPAPPAPAPAPAEQPRRPSRSWRWPAVSAALLMLAGGAALWTRTERPAAEPRPDAVPSAPALAQLPARPTSEKLPDTEPAPPPPAPEALPPTEVPPAAATAQPAAPAPTAAPAPAPVEKEPPRKATATASRPAARPAAKAATGTVTLRVNPWAEVFYAGKTLGVTPMAPIELPSGTQTLTLVNRDLDVEKKVKVSVPANRDVVLRVNLLDGM
ncbi:serine/threonine protein kinase [Hyalangium gracile]|uniref:serine/threonine protein kinase n=1 Tax=Hyalangium gracile TaxID=394092 RepID=UPI001CCB6458|nr:serine/threonine-protein kinase [Hyalangium gracile]